MLEAALSTSPVVTRLLVGTPVRPQKHVSRAPPCCRNMAARALCITIPDDRGDESFADDLNMGRGIVSGRVALLLRSTEIRPHRPKDLLPPSPPENPGSPTLYLPILKSTKSERSLLSGQTHTPGTLIRDWEQQSGLRRGSGLGRKNRDCKENRDSLRESGLGAGHRESGLTAGVGSRSGTPGPVAGVGTPGPVAGVGTPGLAAGHRESGLAAGLRDSQRESGVPVGLRDSQRESGLAAGVGTRSGTPGLVAGVGTPGLAAGVGSGTGDRESGVATGLRDSQRDREPGGGSRSGTPGLAAGQVTGRRQSQRDSGTRSGSRESQRESGVATRRGLAAGPRIPISEVPSGYRDTVSPGLGTDVSKIPCIGTEYRESQRESRRESGVATRRGLAAGPRIPISEVLAGCRDTVSPGLGTDVSKIPCIGTEYRDSQSRFLNFLPWDSRVRDFFLIFFPLTLKIRTKDLRGYTNLCGIQIFLKIKSIKYISMGKNGQKT
jgi:hypothetical protein